jgi:methyltransferase
MIILQRITELIIARRNEKWMKSHGGKEFGQNHYKLIVGIHVLFFLIYIGEVVVFQKNLSPQWYYLFVLFLITQTGRVWALTSLGKFWNTKIIVLPNAKIVAKGPYRFLKHPNYLIVSLEFLIIPLIFQAYFTTVIFTILNLWILSIRIPEEEKALREFTSYVQTYGHSRRFFSKI